uniref:5-formyltetrahydrofolate cyclo-ligase n=1 Tax=Thaumasiovibrio occultus TaxID=1891184 RepID=UPI000B34D084|nr:5-formyltetrahydrofolate cyclo-ligase [Thaumasiovibrio occultus]
MDTTSPEPRKALRQLIRQRRQSLNQTEQQRAAADLVQQAKDSALFSAPQHIALYLANDGELDPMPLIEWLWQQGKHIYLPVLHPFTPGHLLFLRYQRHTPMQHNRYGIAEPVLDVRHVCPLSRIDMILTPLVAFDRSGNRLGMGGGYYDRTLAQQSKLDIVGLAHDCQLVEQIPTESWDVPLPQILTPSQLWHWHVHNVTEKH